MLFYQNDVHILMDVPFTDESEKIPVYVYVYDSEWVKEQIVSE